MSRLMQAFKARRAPTAAANAGPLVQQAKPIVIELIDETVDELGEGEEFLGELPPDQIQAVSAEHPRVHQAPLPLSRVSRFKRLCRRLYRKIGMKHMITLFMMIIYTVIGAAAFLKLEQAQDIERIERNYAAYEDGRREFAQNLSAYMRASRTRITNIPRLERFIEEYDEKRGFKPSTSTSWNFWHAMYFAGTIYTTIGYGDLFCRTVSGRVVTMLYSLIGIPLMLITLTDLGGFLLKLMFAISWLYDACKARLSPTALFGPHPPGFDAKPSKYKSMLVELGEKGTNEAKLEGRADGDDDNLDLYELERREDEHYEYQLMRVPILTALGTTIGWIFMCAGLFCIWEDWDYFTSVYFFFISLSTIGLGDVTPTRKDIMVATYFFVIVGLSLVSMCITVIQRRLEDLYLQLLQMILQEYNRQLMKGSDQMGATVGMMQAWQKSKQARFLMPLLSKDKKITVAKRFQDEAKAQGTVLPAVLLDLNPKSGLPAILLVASAADIEGDAQLQEMVGDAIERATAKARVLNEPVDTDFVLQPVHIAQVEVREHPGKVVTVIPAAPPAIPTSYDADAQTDEMETEDKQEQTTTTPLADAQTQSQDSSFTANLRVDEASQTPIVELGHVYTQCKLDEAKPPPPTSEIAEDQTQTEAAELTEASSQTSKPPNREQLIQTHLYDTDAAETQTDQVQTKNQRLQTPVPEYVEQEAQTDPLILDPEQLQATGTLSVNSDHGAGKRGWDKAKRNLRKVIDIAKTGMHPSGSKTKLAAGGIQSITSLAGIETTPAMAQWTEIVGDRDDDEAGFSGTVQFVGGDEEEEEEEEEEDDASEMLARRASEESLHWDPIDGLHAEPKRKVQDLKKMFEEPQPRRQSERRKSSLKPDKRRSLRKPK